MMDQVKIPPSPNDARNPTQHKYTTGLLGISHLAPSNFAGRVYFISSSFTASATVGVSVVSVAVVVDIVDGNFIVSVCAYALITLNIPGAIAGTTVVTRNRCNDTILSFADMKFGLCIFEMLQSLLLSKVVDVPTCQSTEDKRAQGYQ
jgi:hypothetical protein